METWWITFEKLQATLWRSVPFSAGRSVTWDGEGFPWAFSGHLLRWKQEVPMSAFWKAVLNQVKGIYMYIYIYICLCALHLRATCEMVADSCIQIIDFQRLLSNLVKRLAPISCHWFMIRNPFEIGGLFRRQQHARMSTSNFHTQASKKADTIFVYLALTKRWVTIWFHSPLIWKKQKCEDGIARHVSASVEPQATISHEIHKQIRHDFTTFTFPSFPPSLSSHDCIPIFFFSKILVDHGRHSIKAHTINMKLVYPVMSCTLVSAVYT